MPIGSICDNLMFKSYSFIVTIALNVQKLRHGDYYESAATWWMWSTLFFIFFCLEVLEIMGWMYFSLSRHSWCIQSLHIYTYMVVWTHDLFCFSVSQTDLVAFCSLSTVVKRIRLWQKSLPQNRRSRSAQSRVNGMDRWLPSSKATWWVNARSEKLETFTWILFAFISMWSMFVRAQVVFHREAMVFLHKWQIY